MDKKKLGPPSRNFSDSGNFIDRLLNSLDVNFNPAITMRKVREDRIEKGLLPPPKTSPFGPTNIEQLLYKDLLNNIMKQRDLIDPKVIYSGQYGDLIPADRWERLEAELNRGRR